MVVAGVGGGEELLEGAVGLVDGGAGGGAAEGAASEGAGGVFGGGVEVGDLGALGVEPGAEGGGGGEVEGGGRICAFATRGGLVYFGHVGAS